MCDVYQISVPRPLSDGNVASELIPNRLYLNLNSNQNFAKLTLAANPSRPYDVKVHATVHFSDRAAVYSHLSSNLNLSKFLR